MKTKLPKPILAIIGIAFPFLIIVGYSLGMLMTQPDPITVYPGSDTITSFLGPKNFYYLKGNYSLYPEVLLKPAEITNYDKEVLNITSLSEARSDIARKDDNYVGTLRFAFEVPSEFSYSVVIPDYFCEYKLFVNGVLVGQSETFDDDNKMAGKNLLVAFPYNSLGTYDCVFQYISPSSFYLGKFSVFMFGKTDRMLSMYRNNAIMAIACITFSLFTVFFCIIQLISTRNDRTLYSFIVLSLAIILCTMIQDSMFLSPLTKGMNYQLYITLYGLSTPFLIYGLIIYQHSIFPDMTSKPLAATSCFLQIIPFTNTILMYQYKWLVYLSYIVELVAFAYMVYVFVRAQINHLQHSHMFGIGLSLFFASDIITFITKDYPVPTMHTVQYGFIVLALLEMNILAKRFAEQEESEKFYSSELTKTLEAMQDSENAFLNAQMKPHFLYNTLNTIADLCVTDSAKAKDLIASLKDYCRIILGIDSVEKTVSIKREMELVKSYTAIEKERFPSINFYTDAPIRMPKVQIPPLTLQPLIENAIKHGVRKSEKAGIVTLRIRDTLDNVIFYVSDNGAGMTQDVIDKLFEKPKDNNSIGIYNIDTRLKNLYGDGLHIESTPNFGTCISFTVPKH